MPKAQGVNITGGLAAHGKQKAPAISTARQRIAEEEEAEKAVDALANAPYSRTKLVDARNAVEKLSKYKESTGLYNTLQNDIAHLEKQSRKHGGSSSTPALSSGLISSIGSMMGFGGSAAPNPNVASSPATGSVATLTPPSSPRAASPSIGVGTGKNAKKKQKAAAASVGTLPAPPASNPPTPSSSSTSVSSGPSSPGGASSSGAAGAAPAAGAAAGAAPAPPANPFAKEHLEHKEMADQFNQAETDTWAEAAGAAQDEPDLNARLQVPRDIRRATELPQVSSTYHGPFDRGTLQPYINMAEMGYQGVGGLHVYTGMTAAQVNRTNMKRKRQGYVLYDDVAKEWTHIKKKDIPKGKTSEMSDVFSQAMKKRKIATDAGAGQPQTTGWQHRMREAKQAAAGNVAMNHPNTRQPGDLGG